jgi:hypothetical protein
MNQKRLLLILLVLVGLVALSQVAAGAQTDMEHEDGLTEETRQLINEVRWATSQYWDLDTALEDGYGIFQDCFKDEAIGGMGQHYVKGALAGDDVLDPLQPEALVYQPNADGDLLLVAFEYLVFEENWTSSEPPTLFGQEFHLKTTIPDTPPVWVLHMWLWTHNPEGMFADYNPTIFCPEDVEN